MPAAAVWASSFAFNQVKPCKTRQAGPPAVRPCTPAHRPRPCTTHVRPVVAAPTLPRVASCVAGDWEASIDVALCRLPDGECARPRRSSSAYLSLAGIGAGHTAAWPCPAAPETLPRGCRRPRTLRMATIILRRLRACSKASRSRRPLAPPAAQIAARLARAALRAILGHVPPRERHAAPLLTFRRGFHSRYCSAQRGAARCFVYTCAIAVQSAQPSSCATTAHRWADTMSGMGRRPFRWSGSPLLVVYVARQRLLELAIRPSIY